MNTIKSIFVFLVTVSICLAQLDDDLSDPIEYEEETTEKSDKVESSKVLTKDSNKTKKASGGVLLGFGIPTMGTGAGLIIATAIRNGNANSSPNVQVSYFDTKPRYISGGICAGAGLILNIVGGTLLSRSKVTSNLLNGENGQLYFSYDNEEKAIKANWCYNF